VKLELKFQRKQINDPKNIDIEKVGEQYEGWFVQISGEITEIKGSYMYVDDGTEEVKVYFKRGAGINKKIYQVGDLVNVCGLVGQTRSGFQLLPRSQEDIEKTGVAETMVLVQENVEGEEKKEMAEKYLTATAGGLTSILFGLFAKTRGSNAIKIIKKLAGVGLAVIRRKTKI